MLDQLSEQSHFRATHVWVGIVGADYGKWLAWSDAQKKLGGGEIDDPFWLPKNEIRKIFEHHSKGSLIPILVSGRSPKGGIDVWAEDINNMDYHWGSEIYPPKQPGWPWYKHRNLLIARASNPLYCISVKKVWDGGRWTAKQALKLGKEVHVIEL